MKLDFNSTDGFFFWLFVNVPITCGLLYIPIHFISKYW
jgi:hypothetical protein